MTAKQIAEKTGVHYQTVLRQIRYLAKSDPHFMTGVPGVGSGNRKAGDFDEAKTARILERIEALQEYKSRWNSAKGSNQNQRRAWTDAWQARIEGADEAARGKIFSVLGVIAVSGSIESLKNPVCEVQAGELALRMMSELDLALLTSDPFALWLQESGFTFTVSA